MNVTGQATVRITHTLRHAHVGDIVHYVLPSTCLGGGQCRPAMTIVGGVDGVFLYAFTLRDDGPRSAHFENPTRANANAEGMPGTWHHADSCPNGCGR